MLRSDENQNPYENLMRSLISHLSSELRGVTEEWGAEQREQPSDPTQKERVTQGYTLSISDRSRSPVL